MALICAAYGWKPWDVARLTPAQVQYFFEQLPEVALRDAYPIAALEATLRNMMGGKRSKEPDENSEPPLEPHELYSPGELLPFYARPPWVESTLSVVSAEAARDFLKHRSEVPEWALQLAPIEAIRRAAQ